MDAYIHGDSIIVRTNRGNAAAFGLVLSKMPKRFKKGDTAIVSIDDNVFKVKIASADDTLRFHTNTIKWLAGPPGPLYPGRLVKKHNLQGPIDDAFMSAFIVVKPSGTSKSALFDKWSKSEMNRFIEQWRTQFRGDAIVKMDTDITEADMKSNLIAFGDARSNRFIAKINAQLPIKFTDTDIILSKGTVYPTKNYGLAMIYPNPLNQEHYVVLNSGFTFREDAYLNNSKQIPMLPDWAIIDLNTPPDSVHPGLIKNAAFFNDKWERRTFIVE